MVLHGCVEVIELDFFKVSVWRVFVPVSVPTSTRVHVYTSAVPGKEYRLGLYQLPTRVVYVCMYVIHFTLFTNKWKSKPGPGGQG